MVCQQDKIKWTCRPWWYQHGQMMAGRTWLINKVLLEAGRRRGRAAEADSEHRVESKQQPSAALRPLLAEVGRLSSRPRHFGRQPRKTAAATGEFWLATAIKCAQMIMKRNASIDLCAIWSRDTMCAFRSSYNKLYYDHSYH